MTIKTEPDLTTPALTLHLPVNYPGAEQLLAQLQNLSAQAATLTVSQAGHTVQLPLATILFFEAEGHQVRAHTCKTSYQTKRHLYELATQLPPNFLRVSKSAIVNTQAIYSLTKSLTGNLIEFNHTHKQLYASRRYYRDLKLTLEKETFK
ncbi:LytTR family DNA-binding domain-containing protein [Lactiplantibacillus sp. WILCCON 0030]|uniref:LytTR family DNA-binding domain-containing protein n=1 Tax=Lactiplantibacillus brownii TaxID=3069269 RepID=A0ABU1A8G5_9LACO|nr:LytTR family DNA-binding domain-containing protein [Lactiplantibacillus brownii]MDQ7937226.1 LytTR family DNA-binding domain-containing protein [Lactiplantibacillus brownii]